MLLDFRDSEELSLALRHANVSAMQISRGQFRAQLGLLSAGDWTLQLVRFVDGAAACGGDSPSDRYAFVVPLRANTGCRLLGRPVGEASLGIYAPGSEHADTSLAGYEQVVLMPTPGLSAEAALDEALPWLPARGSHHAVSPLPALDRLRALLESVVSSTGTCAGPMPGDQVRRSLNDAFSTAVSASLRPVSDESNRGRPVLPRAAVMRHLKEILGERSDEPAYASELARTIGVSDATLRRMFVELFGMPPSRYLMIRRLNIARQRLRTGVADTVGEVAAACGFWDHSRFAGRYRSLFGETPVETLRKARRGALSR